MRDVSEQFADFLFRDDQFQEAAAIIHHNTEGGKVWLIGGRVYRNLAHILYGSEQPPVDFDFLVQHQLETVRAPDGWELQENRYGNLKFVGPFRIDYVPLPRVHSILRRGMKPTIDAYLSGTPLTMQSIAYDVQEQQLIGSIGLVALADKTIAVNDIEEARYYASKKKRSLSALIEEKAKQLGFTPIYRELG